MEMYRKFYSSSVVASTLQITLTAWPTLYIFNGIFAKVDEEVQIVISVIQIFRH